MNILVVNDDGIEAEGIRQLVSCLGEGFPEAEIYVCAPDRQRTASGHGITVSDAVTLQVREVSGATKVWSCSGTPADCVKAGIGMMELDGVVPDLLCSGINMGSNVGSDVLYSGTVSAALEGNICRLPSVAFSVCDHKATHFEAFRALVPSVCRRVLAEATLDWVLNVNVPDVPEKEIRGLRFTRLGERIYGKDFAAEVVGDTIRCHLYLGAALHQEGLTLDDDVRALQENYISITPLHRDLTKYGMAEQMRGWDIQWGSK